MGETEFTIDDNYVYRHTKAIEYGKEIYQTEIILTKELVVELYNRWIVGEQGIGAIEHEISDTCP